MDRLGPSERDSFHGSRHAFTPNTSPSSCFHGRWPNGLSITDITLAEEQVEFWLQIRSCPVVGWTVGEHDEAIAGFFYGVISYRRCRSPDPPGRGEIDLFARIGRGGWAPRPTKPSEAATVTARRGQW